MKWGKVGQVFAGWRRGSPTIADAAERLQALLRLTQENRELDHAVRRVREWNSQLLRDKTVLLADLAALAAERDRMSRRLDEAAANLVEAERDRERLRRLVESEQAQVTAHEQDLQRALRQCDHLAARLKAGRKRGRR